MREEPTTAFTEDQLSKAVSFKDELKYIKENIEPIKDKNFSDFFFSYINKKGLVKANIVNTCDLPRSTANDIICGKKENPSRDRIIAITYAANMSVDEMNRALTLSHNEPLYAKSPRDAFIMACIKEKKRGNANFSNVTKLNAQLPEYGYAPLNI